LLAEAVPAEKAAALLELDVSEVRRLVKAAPAEDAGSHAGRDFGGESAARRAGEVRVGVAAGASRR